MKIQNKILALLVVGSLLQSVGFAPYAHSEQNDLSKRDEEIVLDEIKYRCLDTWCEGGGNFYFEKLECFFQYGECLLHYGASAHNRSKRFSSYTCFISVKSKDLIFEDPEVFELSDVFVDQISDCIYDLDE